jgi:hypothetical protein
MNARRILIEARRELMLRLFDRDAVDMIDLRADLDILELCALPASTVS